MKIMSGTRPTKLKDRLIVTISEFSLKQGELRLISFTLFPEPNIKIFLFSNEYLKR